MDVAQLLELLLQLFLLVLSSFLFSFFLSQRFLLIATHAHINHHSGIFGLAN